MPNRSVDSLFKKEIIKFACILISLFIFFVFCTIFVQSLNMAENFVQDVEKDKVLLDSDLKKLHFSFERRLDYISKQLESKSFNKNSIKKIFDSEVVALIDRSSINAIIITDHNKQVIFSDFSNLSNTNDRKINQLQTRKYLEKLMFDPDLVIVGEIVTGILTQVPAIPIATGVKGKHGEFLGSLIFSVGLENLSQNLSRGSLVHINIQDYVKDPIDLLEVIKYRPVQFIVNNIFDASPSVKIVVYNHLIKKFLILEYDISSYIDAICISTIRYSAVILLILALIFCFYYFSILKPIKPSLKIIQKISDSNESVFNNSHFSLFDSMVFSVENQSQLLQKYEYMYKEQLTRIVSVVCSVESLTNYVKNKLECLTEEIQDISSETQSNNAYKNTKINHIKQIVINNESEVNSVLYGFNKVFKLLDSQEKKEFKISEILNESGLDVSLWNNSTKVEIDKIQDYSVVVYQSLFKVMIDEILNFNSQALSLFSINIKEGHILEFTFKEIADNKTMSQHEQLMLCRLWGMFNDILITLEYRRGEMKVICQFK